MLSAHLNSKFTVAHFKLSFPWVQGVFNSPYFIFKGTIMQILKSATIFVFMWKWYVVDFMFQHLLLSGTCVREICEKFFYKRSEKIGYVKN